MRDIILKGYFKWVAFTKLVYGVVSYFTFCTNLLKSGSIRSNDPAFSLYVLLLYLKLNSFRYNNSVITGRTKSKSLELLESLVSTYLENRSEVTLDQVLTVYKEEFIRRG